MLTVGGPVLLKNVPRLGIAVLVCWLAATAQRVPESRLIAQGEYSALLEEKGAVKGRTLDHWLLYQLPDGTFKVDTEIKTVPPAKAEEHLTFTKAMRLAHYEWLLQPHQEGKADLARIRCDFDDAEARCDGRTLKGESFSTSLAIKAPYYLAPITDGPIFDFPWYVQSMIWPVERSVSRSSSISIIMLGHGNTEYGTVLRKVPQKPGLYRYLGRDVIEIVGQKVKAHKFEIKGDSVVLFWFSDSGLLLKNTGPDPGVSFVLSRYEGPAL